MYDKPLEPGFRAQCLDSDHPSGFSVKSVPGVGHISRVSAWSGPEADGKHLFVGMEARQEMKRRWSEEDLALHWQLWREEQLLIDSKYGSSKLGFAALLKFFQMEGRFPAGLPEIPASAIEFVASQLGEDPGRISDYPWDSRIAM